MTLSEELQWRGFVNQTTFNDISDLDKKTRTFYFGVDPSADSMQVGNLAAAMMVRHFIDHDYKAILLVGGATGMIGDPDGKATERDLKTLDEIAKNKAAIAEQYRRVFAGQEFEIVDNYDWFKDINYLDFLRNVGKHVPMSQMLGREFVQSRLREDGAGISYAEFSYALIQGYDFLHLYREKGATLQVSGADQWGNCIAGVELIRRIDGGEAHVYSVPLVINKTTGVKFGKSEGGAVWLDAAKTSPYKFYQFWLNVDDEGVEDYIKIYTLLNKEEVGGLMEEFRSNPAGRSAQKRLAYEVTKLVHGEERADSVRRVSEVLFGGGEYGNLQAEDFETLRTELPVIQSHAGDGLIEPLVAAGAAVSNGDARRALEQGGVYVNGQQANLETKLADEHRLAGGYVVVRKGKNTNFIVQLAG